ncbi:DUF1775 domain-containing protein [Actinopolymorpha sp. B9G3]|uniref:DUF1775 domain-containing protein n=1 Tax=Actinopolymorpha sp. B9G3 TaxID=3158970 RepID=UPI0032D98695
MALCQSRLPRYVTLVLTVLATVLATMAATMLGVLVMAEPAAARVSIVPGTVKGGGTETFAIRLANERQDTSTNRLALVFPDDTPISIVEVTPVKGWTVSISTRPLNPPAEVEGRAVREVAESIVWEGGRVGPGQFEQFLVTLGPLPRHGRLALEATQTYANGDTDMWPDASASSQQNPVAPAITIGAGRVDTPSASPPADDAAAVKSADDSADRGDSAQSAGESGGQSDDDILTLLLVLVLACIGVIFGIALVRQVRTHRSASSGEATDDADQPDSADQAGDTDHAHHADHAADPADEAGTAAATEASTR